MQVVNGYGPTEATIFCSSYTEIREKEGNTPIGRPVGKRVQRFCGQAQGFDRDASSLEGEPTEPADGGT